MKMIINQQELKYTGILSKQDLLLSGVLMSQFLIQILFCFSTLKLYSERKFIIFWSIKRNLMVTQKKKIVILNV